MNHYLVTLVCGNTRTACDIIARSSVQAALIGLRTLPATAVPLRITSKLAGAA